jgi:hypothetical protein
VTVVDQSRRRVRTRAGAATGDLLADEPETIATYLDVDLLPGPRSVMSRNVRRRVTMRQGVGHCADCGARWDSSYAAAAAAQHARENGGHRSHIEARVEFSFVRESDGVG